jgi:hypothetical protein
MQKIRREIANYSWAKAIATHIATITAYMSQKDKYNNNKNEYQFKLEHSLHITLLILTGTYSDAKKPCMLW